MDPEAESRFSFKLSARRVGYEFLAGYSVYSTDNIKPPPVEMHEIVEAHGGVFLHSAPTEHDEHVICVSVAGDDVDALLALGYTVYTNELILSGVLQQKLDLDQHILSKPSKSKQRTADATPAAAAKRSKRR